MSRRRILDLAGTAVPAVTTDDTPDTTPALVDPFPPGPLPNEVPLSERAGVRPPAPIVPVRGVVQARGLTSDNLKRLTELREQLDAVETAIRSVEGRKHHTHVSVTVGVSLPWPERGKAPSTKLADIDHRLVLALLEIQKARLQNQAEVFGVRLA